MPPGSSHNEERERRSSITGELLQNAVYACTERPFGVVNRRHELVYFNRAGDEYINKATGYHLEVGRSLDDYVVPTAWKRYEQAMRRVMSGEYAVTRLDVPQLEEPIDWREYHFRPLQDDRGDVQGAYISIENVSAEQRARHEAERAEAYVRSIVNTAVEGIITVDQDGTVEHFNASAEAMFGYSVDEVVGQSFTMLMPSPYREEYADYIESYRRTGETDVINSAREVEGRRQDGSVFPMHLALGAMEIDGEHKLTATVGDLTERKDLEQRLRRSERMEMLGQLAGGIAHDFNNVLTIICSYVHTSLARVTEDPELKRYLGKIKNAAERGARLTHQLLTFSPSHAWNPEPIDLNALVGDVEQLVHSVLAADIELVVTLEPGLPKIRADRSQIEQVLMNLVVNARDAMPRGGTLTLRTHSAYFGSGHQVLGTPENLPPGTYAMLLVRDSGTGMDEQTREHIFDPFFSTKPEGKGTGLGLATVYGIIQRHRGGLLVDSQPGVGSTFRVYFPAAEQKEARRFREHRVAPHSIPAAPGTVLVVEDEPDVREPLRSALEAEGYAVLEAASGEEARQIIDAHGEEIDVLLTDVVMPGISGVELADMVLEQYPSIRAIVVSGYGGEALERKFIDPNRVRVSKPYDLERLKLLVRDLLDERVR